jgi:ribosomal protein L16 Arg81 hydroxylase
VLSRCIAIDAGVFAADYWGLKPLLSTSDALPRDFCDLLSTDMVDELLAERGVRAPFIRLAKEGEVLGKDAYLGAGGFGAEIADQVDSAKVLDQLGSGATVVLQGLHRLWPPLIGFVRHLVDDLGHPVQANAYITPPNNRGFDFHYDVHDVFVLQVSGRKRWVVHEPVHPHPLPSQPWTEHRDHIALRVTGDAVIDTVLCEGDALYLPRGWVHSAQALDTTSIHLTIGVAATTVLDVAKSVIDQLARDESFRAPLPIGVDHTRRDDTAAAVAKVIAQMVGELRDNATELSATAAEELAARHARRTRADAVRPLATLDAAERAATIDVHWRRGLDSVVDRVGDRVNLRLPDKTITLPALCEPALHYLRSRVSAHAAELPGLDPADGAVLIRRLLREAVVVPAEQTPRP